MIRVSYEVNGRRFSNPRNAAEALTQALMREVGEEVAREIGSVRCPRHGTTPEARIVSSGRETMEIHLSGCCDELVDAARGRLRQSG